MRQTVSFSIADFNAPAMDPEEEADEAFMDEDEDVENAQSGGANTKGAINQGRTSGGNIKVAPEDSISPADRDELHNEEVSHTSFLTPTRLTSNNSRTTTPPPKKPSPPT
jgi:complement component 1 Q subcomponent-binding protein